MKVASQSWCATLECCYSHVSGSAIYGHSVFTPVIISCYEGCKYATLLFTSAFIPETPAVYKLLHVMMLKPVNRVKRKHKTRDLQECLCPALYHHENVYRLHGWKSFLAQLSSFICSSNYIPFFIIWRNSPQWARASSFTRFLDLTHNDSR
jgi:hypothetical protein